MGQVRARRAGRGRACRRRPRIPRCDRQRPARARWRVQLRAGGEPRAASPCAAGAHSGADFRWKARVACGTRAFLREFARDAVRQSGDGGRRAGGAGDAGNEASPATRAWAYHSRDLLVTKAASWPLIASIGAIAISPLLVLTTGSGLFYNLSLFVLMITLWSVQRLTRREVGIAVGDPKSYSVAMAY